LVTPPAAILLQLAIARRRRICRRRNGARLTGRPDVVAGVLARVEIVDEAGSKEAANNIMARTMVAIGRRLVGPRRDNPFSAHPLPANRMVALVRLSREMGPD
jgi:Zn-dependent protease with chaperone function